MKKPDSKKSSIDWYFSRLHGHVMLPSIKNKQSGVPADTCSHGTSDNLETRHRVSWRLHSRRLFGGLLIGLLVSQASLFAAEAALSSVTKAKAAQKAEAKAKIAAKAKKTYPKEAKKSEKTVSGTVVSVHQKRISVEVAQSEEQGAEEILIPIGDGLKLSNAESLKHLAYGDLVEVKFIEIFMPGKKTGEISAVLDTRALEIRLVEKAADRAAKAAVAAGALPA